MNFLINSALTLASNQLKYFSRLNNFWQVFDTAFGTQYNRSLAEILRLQWEAGDFSQLPQIEVLDSSILGGANGAYASSKNKIYLSNTFVASASLAAISGVLLEEIGHFVDAKINQTDSAGDEGAIFAALVQGQNLDVETLRVLKAEDDHSIITLNNRQIDIEQANTTLSLPGLSGSVAWADYNGDGKQDLLLTGSTSSGNISKLYKNTGNGFTEDTTVSLPDVYRGSAAWADYNGDGKQDFLLTGSTSSGYISKLYKNTGNGFTEDTTVSLPGVYYSSVDWADYNGDGKQDLLLTGYTDSVGGWIVKLYKNTGNGFTEDTTVSLPGVSGSVAWADYNGDGKQDFLLTGYTGSRYISKLYKNTGNGFTEDITVSLPSVSFGSVTWADYNGDSKQDFLLTGSTGSGPISKLYKNTGNGFTEDTTISLPGVSGGSVAWADYNSDSKQDFLLTGYTDSGYISKLYKNTGNGFTEDTTVSLPGVSGDSVAWADYNSDSKQDFLLTGYTDSGYISKLYKNTGNGFTEDTTVSLPGISDGSVVYFPGISDGSIAWADYNSDSKQDFLLTGYTDSGYISKLYKNTGNGFTEDTTVSLPGISDGSIAWADYNGDGKQEFLLTGVTYISKLYKNTGNGFTEDTTVSLPGVSRGSVAWADYNGDGKQDFLLTGWLGSGYISKLYKNTGNGFTEDTTVSLPGVDGSVAWADYNGDGKQDFLLTGYTGSGDVSKLYKNTGNGFTEDTTVSLPGLSSGSVDWADYNGDGKQDFLLTGYTGFYATLKLYKNTGNGFTEDTTVSSPGAFSNSVDWVDYNGDDKQDLLFIGDVSKLYKNTGNGFTEDTTISLPGLSSGSSVAWADYNGDGKQDLLLTGYTGSGDVSKLYKNTGNGFTEDTTVSLPSVDNGSVDWVDYNGDGKQDLLLTGFSTGLGYISKLYKNTGNGFTEDTTISLPGLSSGSVDWVDYNGDGKQDLLLTGFSTGLGYISKLYKNTGNGFTEDTTVSLPGLSNSSVTWADYNGDGKQDFLLTGVTYISKLYKNTGNGFEEDINANQSDTNQAPTNITLNNSTIAENQPINTVVGNFTTTDPNTGDTFTYSLVSGTGDTNNNSFIIVGNNELQTKAVFDYETKNSYSIRVKTTDQGGLSFEKQLTIGVTDINETVANLSISPSNVTQTEGNLGNKPFTFTVTRTGDTTGTNSVNWSVSSASFDDFANTTGTITFAPGEISKDIIVNVKGDLTQENNETFTVNLSSFNNNATITTATATGTITNDDLALATIQLPFPIKLITKLSPLLVGNLQIVGNYAYVATGSDGLEIIDISDPTNPIIKGRWNYNITSGPVTSGYVYSVQVIGNYAYAASIRGLEIIDISNPTAPTLKGNYNVSGFSRGVQVLNDYAYMAAGDLGLQIIDISNPSNPTLKGNYDTGPANDVQVIGNNAYVADVSGLQIIDISNPSNPTLKGNYNITDFTYDVQVLNDYAYIATGDSGLRIIDISNPSNPSLQASYVTKREAYNVGLVGNYAYVSGDRGLEIIDISNPSSPTLKGYYNSGNMQVVGNYAYVAGTFGLQIIDITDITKAIPKGNYDTGNYAQSVQVVDNYAYVSASDAGLQIIDITDPTKPILKGNYDTPGYAHNVQLLGNYAYVADGLSGLQIIDISNATTPTLKGNYDTLGYAHDVQLLGNYAYVADGLSGLQIIDISDPSVPSLKENYNTPGDANDVQVVGNYAYVADGLSGLQIIDISDPTKPILKGNYKSTYQTYADNVRVVGKYAYLLYDYSGTEIIDISDPSKPTLKSKDDLSYGSYGYDVQVIGNYAYVVDDREIKVIDVGDFTDTNQAPTNITLNNSTIAENQPINTKIGNFTTTDPNTANAFTYSLVSGTGDTDNDSFIIVGNNELQTKAVFDYETKNSYSIRVKTTDQGGLSFEEQLTIGVTDVNETPTNQAPTNITLNNSTIAENQPINTVVGNFTTIDPDEGNTFTYTLVSGTGDTDNNVFTITNNELKTNSGFDYETKNNYSIRVKTTDQGGLSFEKQLTIGVTDVNEAPVITSPTTANFAENGTGTVYTVIATDVDAGTPLYSLSGTDA
ncbi:MAG: FG-GAP-like repeat-containing protein, partial [Aphanizomenon gracile PMC649.10]|nr:FG-GAP-like repeat-containing protein [Aphanizomenon gracile PMC649.10]